jgi:peptidoglycan L-alanyl-D-glutamate endopeptidase CwlK
VKLLPFIGGVGLFASLYWALKPREAMAASAPDKAPEPEAPKASAPAASAPAGGGGGGGGGSSEARIARLEPVIQSKARALLDAARAQGIELTVTQGLRTMDEQAALYAQGRTAPGQVVTNAKPGSSWHNFGLAFDVAVVVNGKPTWPSDQTLWDKIGELGKAQGLVWGGDFQSFKDMPHFQYTGGLTLEQARAGQRPA